MTSSPTSPRTGLPDSSHASSATPRYGADNSPGHTGTVGTPPMNADTTSVPPLIDATCTPLPTLSRNHSDDDDGSDDPVMPTVRSADRSCSRRGTAPALAHPSTYPGLVPNTVAPMRAAISQRASGRGADGLPS